MRFVPKVLGRPTLEIDSGDTAVSNWLRYINCARSADEKNLETSQIRGEIFNITTKVIPAYVY